MWQRLLKAIQTRPTSKGWAECVLMALVAVALIAAIAFPGGVAAWRPDFSDWPQHLLKVMIVPALGEEIVFRGLLIPGRGDTVRPIAWITAGVAFFVAWHVIEALTVLPGAHLFLTVPFLVCAGILGLACALMRYRTRSLWPAVLFHGLVVFLWQAAFNGPEVAVLLKP